MLTVNQLGLLIAGIALIGVALSLLGVWRDGE